MAVPKQRKSKSKSRMRRAQYLKIPTVHLSPCKNCKKPRPSHVVCPYCGYYKNKIVIQYSE